MAKLVCFDIEMSVEQAVRECWACQLDYSHIESGVTQEEFTALWCEMDREFEEWACGYVCDEGLSFAEEQAILKHEREKQANIPTLYSPMSHGCEQWHWLNGKVWQFVDRLGISSFWCEVVHHSEIGGKPYKVTPTGKLVVEFMLHNEYYGE